MNSDPTHWFVRYSRGPAPARVLAFPYAGGGASVFRDWGARLPGAELYGAQLPGRERRLRETPIGDLEQLLDQLLAPCLALTDRPFVLFGHSMGALVAYELAHRLQARGRIPLAVIVSAFRSPDLPARSRPLHALAEDELVAGLRGYGATASEVFEHPELLALLLPMVRADFRLHETYRFPGHRTLACPLTAIAASDDRHVPEEDMLGWGDKTTGPFAHRRVAGGHFYLLENPDLPLAEIQATIRNIAADTGTAP